MTTKKEDFLSALGTQLQNNSAKNKGINATFQFDIGGSEPIKFYFSLNDGAPTLAEGVNANPNITISMSSDDFAAMLEGKLNGTMAYMSGKLKIAGDMSLAMKMESILK